VTGESVAPLRLRAANFERASRRRLDEARCAWEFLIHGDTRGEHAATCVRPGGAVCSRDYDPGPAPEDEALYAGTGIAALYGGPMETSSTYTDSHDVRHHVTRSFAWQLAGWNVRKRKA
jgi:hypothetical protein